jgi:hypothetical protein
MAWVEQIGTHSWRVRYRRDDGTHGSLAGFRSKKTAQASAHDMEADQRRGTWLDPAGAQTTVADWVARWSTHWTSRPITTSRPKSNTDSSTHSNTAGTTPSNAQHHHAHPNPHMTPTRVQRGSTEVPPVNRTP